MPPEPKTPSVPAMWRFNDVRRIVLEAGTLITAKEAERRVLVFENRALRGKSRITQSLYAGLQLILPVKSRPRIGTPLPRFAGARRGKGRTRLWKARGR